MCLFKCIKGLVSENLLAVNVLTSPKNSWNLRKSTFLLLFHFSERIWFREKYFSSDLRFEDCLLKRWLRTTSILVVIERIYRYQFKSNCLKNHKVFAEFFCSFRIYIKFPMFWKRQWASWIKCFWSYWLRKMCLFKCITGLVSENPLTVNVLTSPKNSWNLQKSTFILLFHHFEPNWVRKS